MMNFNGEKGDFYDGSKEKFEWQEKFAYGIGAVGKDMVYMLSASYISIYFLDVMGISAAAIAVLLMAARVFDAFNDPIMGVLVAKTKTRWGKFRPWLLVGTVTNAVVLYLMFTIPPELNGAGLVAYASVTYILWGMTYTMMDIPFWSMIPAFTEAGKKRGIVCICTFLRRCRLRTGIDRHGHECCRTWKSIRWNDRQ